MKIIGSNKTNFLIEISPHELARISGQAPHQFQDMHGGCRNISGTEVNVHDAWDHLSKALNFDDQRKAVAEQFRAAATIIETTPSFVSFPDPDPATSEPGESTGS